jgi:hypothetical protein
MSRRRIVRSQKALFPRSREIREEELGWEVVELVSRLPGHKPSASSIYRLEQGLAIRASNARRVFDVVNAALNNMRSLHTELRRVWLLGFPQTAAM